MKTRSRKRAPKSLPPAVSDLVAEGGNVLASDDTTLTVTSAGIASDGAMSSAKRAASARQSAHCGNHPITGLSSTEAAT